MQRLLREAYSLSLKSWSCLHIAQRERGRETARQVTHNGHYTSGALLQSMVWVLPGTHLIDSRTDPVAFNCMVPCALLGRTGIIDASFGPGSASIYVAAS